MNECPNCGKVIDDNYFKGYQNSTPDAWFLGRGIEEIKCPCCNKILRVSVGNGYYEIENNEDTGRGAFGGW